MKRNLSVFVVIIVSCLAPISSAYAASKEDKAAALVASSSSWVNQSGSTMSLTFTPDSSNSNIYILTGNYINNASGYACQGTSYPLTGRYYINTQTLSFNVVWSNSYADCQSVTGWTGYFSYSSGWRIITDWNLAYQNSSGQMTIASGSDTFTQTSTKTHPSLVVED